VRTFVGILLAVHVLVFGAVAVQAADCDRESFKAWKQINKQDTRARILIDRAINSVVLNQEGNRVLFGTWYDHFSGMVLSKADAQRVQIDHVIPVCWAWAHGADTWTEEMKKAFYNDERFLQILESGTNSRKSDHGPDRFLPVNQVFACEYIRTFNFGVREYNLKLSNKEISDYRLIEKKACAYDGVPGAATG
jgi:hypothetical protein